MTEPKDVSLDVFKVLTQAAGMTLTDAELDHLKPMYDHFARLSATLHQVELDDEDLALVYVPDQPQN